jgi:hypothetical protein
VKVKVFHNQNPLAMLRSLNGKAFGEDFKLVDEFEVTEAEVARANSVGGGTLDDVLEYIFRIHNAVDGSERNVKLHLRSLSVGDVVELDGQRWVCAGTGWEQT